MKTRSNSFVARGPLVTDKQITTSPNITDNTKSGIQTSHVNFINIKNLLDKKLFDKNGNKLLEEEIQIITNSNILNDTKHYEIKFVKIAKILFFMGLLILLILSALNILTSITNFDFYNDVNIISKSFLSRFSMAVQYMNQVRLTVFYNDRTAEAQTYFNKLTIDIDLNNDNKTVFINSYSKYLPKTNAYFDLIIGKLNDDNKPLLCPVDINGVVNDSVCELNSKGINEAYNSAVRLINLIYKDFMNSKTSYSKLEEIKGFF
jgi:hypothetical protein